MNTSQVVLITGSNSGFGRLTVETLSKAGYQVYASMRQLHTKNAEAAKNLQAWAEAEKVSVKLVEIDVTDEASVQSGVSQVLADAGRIDVLVNNAGFGVAGVQEAFTLAQTQSVFEVNVFGVLRMCRAVLPAMRAQRSGLVVHISSGLGRMVLPFVGPYAASKFALEALGEAMRYELQPFGVDSVIVEPGAYPTTEFGGKILMPEDQATLQSYGAVAEIPGKMFAKMAENARHNPPNPQSVAEIIKNLIETPFGQRPLRTVSGNDVKAVEIINEASRQVQENVLAYFMPKAL
ncbi:MAG: SDR family oxidoreductase [Microscillaceae bacterium]